MTGLVQKSVPPTRLIGKPFFQTRDVEARFSDNIQPQIHYSGSHLQPLQSS
jgi:hypothetical protein